MVPVYSGYLQCKMLGAAIEAWDENGNSVLDQTGELPPSYDDFAKGALTSPR